MHVQISCNAQVIPKKNVRDVKGYLHVAIAKDGLLVVKRDVPFYPTPECIVFPCSVPDGRRTSKHISLDRP